MLKKVTNWIYEKYKKVPVAAVGVTAFLIIILFLTLIFNWFWSGLGTDPTHYKTLSFTKDLNEFKDYATLYIALLSFGAALFAGLAVFLVFSDWKEQKRYELSKQYAENALNLVNEIYKYLNSEYYSFYRLNSDLDKRYIALNSYYKNENVFNLTDTLYRLNAEIEILILITEGEFPKALYTNLETDILLLANAINSIEKKYKAYYDKLPDKLKDSKNDKYQEKEGTSYENSWDIHVSENSLKERINQKFIIEIQTNHQGDWIPYEYTYTEYKNQFHQSNFIILEKLIKIIKI